MINSNTESTWFVRLTMDMFQDDDLKGLKNDAILLYAYMKNRMEITSLANDKGEKYIIVTEKSAEKYCRIKKVTFYSYKKQLKELGLIRYNEQKPKKGGVSTPIYVVPYEEWKKKKATQRKSKMEETNEPEMPDIN